MAPFIIESQQKADEIQEKIASISKCLKSSKISNIGLMGGKSGLILFWAYFSRYSSDFNLDIIKNIINEIIIEIKENKTLPSFCDGIAGFGWTLEHLKQEGFIEISSDSLLNSFDEFLYPHMIKQIKQGYYDYLHGALGIGIYYLSRSSNERIIGYLIELLTELEIQATKTTDGITWKSRYSFENNIVVFNLSMSHGLASIISILSLYYKSKICSEKVLELAESAVNFLLNNRYKSGISKYCFPSYVCLDKKVEGNFGRLSWCYNDLGIAMALLNAGLIFNKSTWLKHAINTLENAATILDWDEAGVNDACLCHGTAGIAHIYARAFKFTGIEQFKDTAAYWYSQSLKMAQYKDGLAGFKTFKSDKFGGLQNDYGFLEGISGIGLSLLSSITNIQPFWDKSLLLS